MVFDSSLLHALREPNLKGKVHLIFEKTASILQKNGSAFDLIWRYRQVWFDIEFCSIMTPKFNESLLAGKLVMTPIFFH